MKCIVGLGNPEPKYSKTRHNIGMDFLNRFVSFLNKDSIDPSEWKTNKYINADVCEIKAGLFPEKVTLIKPQVYMNESGVVVSKALDFYEVKSADLMVVYDELDLTAGEYKINFDKSSRIHNGILSVKDHIKTSAFWNLRIGVRNESIAMSVQKAGMDPVKYVLSKFDTTDSGKILECIKNSIVPDLTDWLSKN